jgi:hypothetical protein
LIINTTSQNNSGAVSQKQKQCLFINLELCFGINKKTPRKLEAFCFFIDD